MKPDLVSVIEASYRRCEAPAEWLTGVVEGIKPFIDGGAGVAGLVFSDALSSSPQLLAVASTGVSDRLMQSLQRMQEIATVDETRRRFQASGAVSTLSRTLAGTGVHHRILAESGVVDADCLISGAFDNVTCVIVASREGRRRRPRHQIRVLEHLTAHIAAGSRLVGRQARRTAESPEAILDPDGRLQHATGLAKETDVRGTLRDAARTCEIARGRLRRAEPEDAVASWGALVAGRWSLIDQFDSDGRRFIIARPNERVRPPHAPLSAREGQVVALVAAGHANKLIAYELGLSLGTIATHIVRAQAKLGVRSRAELIQLFPTTISTTPDT